MSVLSSLKSLGVDTDNDVAVVFTIRSFGISDAQKQALLTHYLNERGVTLSAEAQNEAVFL